MSLGRELSAIDPIEFVRGYINAGMREHEAGEVVSRESVGRETDEAFKEFPVFAAISVAICNGLEKRGQVSADFITGTEVALATTASMFREYCAQQDLKDRLEE